VADRARHRRTRHSGSGKTDFTDEQHCERPHALDAYRLAAEVLATHLYRIANEEVKVSKARTKRSIAALIKAATKAAEELDGDKANWIHVKSKGDRSGVILTTVIAGKPLARITFNREQLDELIVLLETSRKEIEAEPRPCPPMRRSRKSS
jgi:hypothetical protein